MLKRILISFTLPVVLLLGNEAGNHAAVSATGAQPKQDGSQNQTGTLQKMIVASGSVALDLDLSRLNGIPAVAGQNVESLHFAVTPNSFFTILVFNDLLRAAETGTMTLVPQNTASLPAPLSVSLQQLAVEKLPSDAAFDLGVHDGKTGFVFFNVEGTLYDYDAGAQLLTITEGR